MGWVAAVEARLTALLMAVEGSAVSVGLRGAEWVYPLVNMAHILGIALLVGPILILDVRLLRGSIAPAPAVLAAVLLPAARTGLALAMLAGLLLWAARPLDYSSHTLFQLKLACIGLALINIAALHRSRAWRRALSGHRPNGWVRLACGLSLMSWLAALGLGRLVGYR